MDYYYIEFYKKRKEKKKKFQSFNSVFFVNLLVKISKRFDYIIKGRISSAWQINRCQFSDKLGK